MLKGQKDLELKKGLWKILYFVSGSEHRIKSKESAIFRKAKFWKRRNTMRLQYKIKPVFTSLNLTAGGIPFPNPKITTHFGTHFLTLRSSISSKYYEVVFASQQSQFRAGTQPNKNPSKVLCSFKDSEQCQPFRKLSLKSSHVEKEIFSLDSQILFPVCVLKTSNDQILVQLPKFYVWRPKLFFKCNCFSLAVFLSWHSGLKLETL